MKVSFERHHAAWGIDFFRRLRTQKFGENLKQMLCFDGKLMQQFGAWRKAGLATASYSCYCTIRCSTRLTALMLGSYYISQHNLPVSWGNKDQRLFETAEHLTAHFLSINTKASFLDHLYSLMCSYSSKNPSVSHDIMFPGLISQFQSELRESIPCLLSIGEVSLTPF